MRAGLLRNVVEIQRRDENVTTTGGSAPVWIPVRSNVRARIEPLTARELVAAAQAQMRATVKITIRYHPELTSKHRLVQTRNGRTIEYAIEEVIDPDQMHREQVVMATAVEAA